MDLLLMNKFLHFAPHPDSQVVCSLMQTQVALRNRRRPRQCIEWSKTFLSKLGGVEWLSDGVSGGG